MSKLNKYLNPKNQIAFRHIFDPENNQDILVAMLNAVLERHLHKPIQSVAFVKNAPKKKVGSRGENNLEFICRDEDGDKYIIMVQMVSGQGPPPRSNADHSSPYAKKKGEDIYKGSREVIFLAFTDYILFANTKVYKSEYTVATKPTSRKSFKRLLSVIVELPKFFQQCTSNIEELSLEEKFYYFLDQASSVRDEELKKLVAQNDIIQKAFDLIDVFSWDREKLASYQKSEGKN